MRTPEEYFEQTVSLPDERLDQGELTPAEQAFVEKYMGMEGQEALKEMPVYDPRGEDSLPGFAARPQPESPAESPEDEQSLEEQLRNEAELQLVSFLVAEQEFSMPITAIQEVIRYMEPTKLPAAPFFMRGIVNLRGRVTPLVDMRALLGITDGDEQGKFIVVCRHRGLQVGLIVSSVKTMYRVPQERIEWGIESHVGISASFLAGLMKSEGNLISIISVDRLVARVLGK